MYHPDSPYLSHPRQDERERANAILASCANKPVRRITTELLGLDRYRCVSRNPVAANPSETLRGQERSEQRALQARVVSHLIEHGATTGKELARMLDSTVGKIGKACTHHMIGRSKVLDPVSKSEGLLFYIRKAE